MERRIKVSDDLRRKIAKTFGVTETTVRSALRYDAKKGQTDTAVKIRVMESVRPFTMKRTVPWYRRLATVPSWSLTRMTVQP